jgi:hypothetical protein
MPNRRTSTSRTTLPTTSPTRRQRRQLDDNVVVSRKGPSTKTRWREGLSNPIKRPKAAGGRHEMSKGAMPHTL